MCIGTLSIECVALLLTSLPLPPPLLSLFLSAVTTALITKTCAAETLIGMVWVITLKYKEDGLSHVGLYSPSQLMIRLTRDSCRTQEARRSESASKGQGDRSRPDTEDGLVCIGTYNSQTSILSPASLSLSLSHSCNKSYENQVLCSRERPW